MLTITFRHHDITAQEHGREVCGEFFIACGDATVLFEQIETAFHPMASRVTMTIIVAASLAVGARWNDRCGVVHLDPLDQGIRVIALIPLPETADYPWSALHSRLPFREVTL